MYVFEHDIIPRVLRRYNKMQVPTLINREAL